MIGVLCRSLEGSNVECEDPLIPAIKAFREGMADYNANAPEDDALAKAYASVSYIVPRMVLVEWALPARTPGGAVAALRLAKEAERDDDLAIVRPMIGAALRYLEQGQC